MLENKELDKRVERSRQALMNALTELMREHAYSKISVAQICAHSGVARPTFYLHYSSKDDLLRGFIEVMFNNFYQQVHGHLIKSPDTDPIIGEIMFKQWSDNADLAKLMVNADVESLMLNEFKRYVNRVFEFYIKTHNPPIKHNSTLLPYVTDFITGATFMVIVRWIKDDFPVDATTMGNLYANLIRPGLLQVMVSGKITQ